MLPTNVTDQVHKRAHVKAIEVSSIIGVDTVVIHFAFLWISLLPIYVSQSECNSFYKRKEFTQRTITHSAKTVWK